MLNQYRYFVVRLLMKWAQVVAVASFVTLEAIAIVFGKSTVIDFPVPFFPVLVAPGWVLGLGIGIAFVWGQYSKQDPKLRRELVHYAVDVDAEVAMILVYPAYIFAFRKLSGPVQIVCALFLPVTKVLAKNVMNRLLGKCEDAKPEFIIFNVEVFHALCMACCMQNITSYQVTAALVATDFFFVLLALRRIIGRDLRRRSRILERERERLDWR